METFWKLSGNVPEMFRPFATLYATHPQHNIYFYPPSFCNAGIPRCNVVFLCWVVSQVLQEVLTCGRTVLVVAQQLKTVEKADHIIFIEKGAVVEEGTHEQLMAKEGRYYRLKEELFS